MFKRLVIELEGPICKCAEPNLQWCCEPHTPPLGAAQHLKYGLAVWCARCETTIRIEPEALLAHISILNPGKIPESRTKELWEQGKLFGAGSKDNGKGN